MPPPSVAAEPPPGWIPSDVARPLLGGGSGATVTQWRALRSETSGDTLLLGCVATPIPGWVEDMRPSVQARGQGLAIASAERMLGASLDARADGARMLLRRAGSAEEAAPVGSLRTFLGWSHDEVVTCFAACAGPEVGERGPRSCDAIVDAARLESGTEPPPPGVVLGAVTWGVHHPSGVVVWGGLLTFLVGAVAVGYRRRPRSRI